MVVDIFVWIQVNSVFTSDFLGEFYLGDVLFFALWGHPSSNKKNPQSQTNNTLPKKFGRPHSLPCHQIAETSIFTVFCRFQSLG